MLSKLHIGDTVELTLRDKTEVKDVVIAVDRDGTCKFKTLGYRFRSGMQFVDHLSKKDIVAVKVTGGQALADEVPATDEELREMNVNLTKMFNDTNVALERAAKALDTAMGQLSRCMDAAEFEAFQLEIDAILAGSKDATVVADATGTAEGADAQPAPKPAAKSKKANKKADATGTAEGADK